MTTSSSSAWSRRIPKQALDTLLVQALLEAQQLTALQERVEEWHDEREDLASYMPAVHRTDDDPPQPAIPTEHIRLFLDTIADDSLGHTLIIAPPGSAKTLSCIAGAGWLLGKNPNLHIGYLSETHTQAASRSVAIRDTIAENPDYRAIFPEAQPDRTKSWTEGRWFLWRNDRGDKDPSMYATGAGGPIQGSRLDYIFLDDIASLKNMATAEQRQKVITWLNQIVKTRLSPRGRLIMICTRWHHEDPAAWAMGEGWKVVRIKAVEEDVATGVKRSYWPTRWPLYRIDCIAAGAEDHGQGDPTWEYSEGRPQAPCWVERNQDGEIIRQGRCLRSGMTQREFNLTYQGDTTDDSASIFKRGDWRYWPRTQPFPVDRGALFVDLAHEEKTEADYTVVSRWLSGQAKYLCTDVIRRRWEFPEVLALLRGLVKPQMPAHEWPDNLEVLKVLHSYGRYRPNGNTPECQPPFPNMSIVIERTPGSKGLIQTLKREVPGVLGWGIASRYGPSKLGRANSIAHLVEAHNVYLLEGAPWIGDFIEEHAIFDGSNDNHDDQVDTTTMALLRFTGGGVLTTSS